MQYNKTEKNRIEHNITEHNRIEQNRTEQNRIEQYNIEQKNQQKAIEKQKKHETIHKKNTVTRRVRRVGSNTKTETRVKETELRRRKVGRS